MLPRPVAGVDDRRPRCGAPGGSRRHVLHDLPHAALHGMAQDDGVRARDDGGGHVLGQPPSPPPAHAPAHDVLVPPPQPKGGRLEAARRPGRRLVEDGGQSPPPKAAGASPPRPHRRAHPPRRPEQQGQARGGDLADRDEAGGHRPGPSVGREGVGEAAEGGGGGGGFVSTGHAHLPFLCRARLPQLAAWRGPAKVRRMRRRGDAETRHALSGREETTRRSRRVIPLLLLVRGRTLAPL